MGDNDYVLSKSWRRYIGGRLGGGGVREMLELFLDELTSINLFENRSSFPKRNYSKCNCQRLYKSGENRLNATWKKENFHFRPKSPI